MEKNKLRLTNAELCCSVSGFLVFNSQTQSRQIFRDFYFLTVPHLLQPALTLSSAPSGQSLSPSHFQRCGTHMWEPGHWNASGLQVLDSETTLRESYITAEHWENLRVSSKSLRWAAGESSFAWASGKLLITYCISGPRRSRRRSRRNRHTPSGRRCSGGSRIQTGWMCRICLQRTAQRLQQVLLTRINVIFHVQ